jgi:serine protease inhibitor
MRPRSFTLRAAILLSMLFVVGCDTMSTEPAPEPLTELPRALSQSERVIIDAGNRFAVDLLRQVHTAAPDSTVFLSPLSASMALGMTMNGAAGETLDQMRETLGFGALSLTEINDSYHDLIELLRSLDPRVDVRLANAIFHRDRFQIETSFLNATRSAFDAEVRGLDFDDPGSVGVINAWVKTATANRIDEIIEAPIHPLTMAFLINAIYFNGDWTQAFDAADTRPAPFRLPDGSSSTVQMMGLELETLPYRNGPGWVATELPYGNGAWVMTVAVPTRSNGTTARSTSFSPASSWSGSGS